jgi:hypothetical protein
VSAPDFRGFGEEVAGWAYLNAAIRNHPIAFPRENVEREAIRAKAEATVRTVAGPKDALPGEWVEVTQVRGGAGVEPGLVDA